jgi:hypothetical protein
LAQRAPRIMRPMANRPSHLPVRPAQRATPWRSQAKLAGLVFAATIFSASAVHAFPSSRLIYVRGKGTEQCPDEDIVRTEVSSRLGYDPFFVWAERTIVAQLSREGRQFHAIVQLLDARGVVRGSRALSSSENCAELVKAVALAISIGIDPDSATHSHPKATPADDRARSSPGEQAHDVAPADPPVVAVSPSAQPPKEEGVVSVARTASRIEAEIGAGVWSAVNVAPVVSVGGALFAGARWGPLAFYLELKQNLPASGDGISAALLTGAFLPCARQSILFACANASWGELSVEGARSASARYVAVGGRLGVQINAFRQLSLRFQIEGLRSLDETVVMQGPSEVWRLPPVSGALGTDASLRF